MFVVVAVVVVVVVVFVAVVAVVVARPVRNRVVVGCHVAPSTLYFVSCTSYLEPRVSYFLLSAGPQAQATGHWPGKARRDARSA